MISRNDRELVEQNKQLRKALETLLSEMDANNYAVDTDTVRGQMPDRDDEIKPPWERDGYETKADWMADKRE